MEIKGLQTQEEKIEREIEKKTESNDWWWKTNSRFPITNKNNKIHTNSLLRNEIITIYDNTTGKSKNSNKIIVSVLSMF